MEKITLFILVLLTTFVTINAEIKGKTMTPGYAEIVKCPYCGAEKELMTLASGNTFGAEYWSDNKCIAPMLPKVSFVQKCHNCGKYYVKYKQQIKTGTKTSFEKGELCYPEWKEAYAQFLQESQRPEEYTRKETRLGGTDWTEIRMCLIHAYNDCFYRANVNDEEAASDEEHQFVVGVINDFIDTFDWSKVEKPLLKAELYREANEMEKCTEVLSVMSGKGMNSFERGIYDEIKERMERGDTKVFKLGM